MVPKKVAEILRTPKSKAQPLISDKPDKMVVYGPSAGPAGQICRPGPPSGPLKTHTNLSVENWCMALCRPSVGPLI
jgi:hypothetical protein